MIAGKIKQKSNGARRKYLYGFYKIQIGEYDDIHVLFLPIQKYLIFRHGRENRSKIERRFFGVLQKSQNFKNYLLICLSKDWRIFRFSDSWKVESFIHVRIILQARKKKTGNDIIFHKKSFR